MAPEYGSTAVLFPVDHLTLDYLRMTGRNEDQIKMIEEYSKSQHLWRDDRETPTYSRTIKLDLSSVVPSVSGPKNPDHMEMLELAELETATATNAPTIITDEIALVTDIKGVCNAGVTLHTT